MNDKELSTLGERIYSGLVGARLSAPALTNLVKAITARRAWGELGERTKISAFVVASEVTRLATEGPSFTGSAVPPRIDESDLVAEALAGFDEFESAEDSFPLPGHSGATPSIAIGSEAAPTEVCDEAEKTEPGAEDPDSRAEPESVAMTTG